MTVAITPMNCGIGCSAQVGSEARPWLDEHLHRSTAGEAESESVFVAQAVGHEARLAALEDRFGMGGDIGFDTAEAHRPG